MTLENVRCFSQDHITGSKDRLRRAANFRIPRTGGVIWAEIRTLLKSTWQWARSGRRASVLPPSSPHTRQHRWCDQPGPGRSTPFGMRCQIVSRLELDESIKTTLYEAQSRDRKVRYRGASMPSDCALDPDHEPPIGAHMVTRRWGYTHHGIYVGRGRVVQYGGLSLGLRRGPVEEVTLSQFALARAIWIRSSESKPLNRDEVVRRARSRLGENRYHVLRNNCEHFCEWCVCGEHRSYQVERLIACALFLRHLGPSTSLARSISGNRF